MRKLYVDGFNFADGLGFTSNPWNIDILKQKINEFVQASKSSNLELAIFIDAGIKSNEAMLKWGLRREKEVIDQYRDVITCQNVLMGEIFNLYGVNVYYSPANEDCDDCLASYANNDHASILSNDKDFFRYAHRKYHIYGSFKIKNGKLKLIEKKRPNKIPSPRDIPNKMTMETKHPSLIDVFYEKKYLRGVPTPLVRLCGNPHSKLVNLRKSIYAKIGCDEVSEIWPEWNNELNTIKWHNEKVLATHDFDTLFDMKPTDLVVLMFGNPIRPDHVYGNKWKNHLLSLVILVFELYAIYHDIKLLDVFDLAVSNVS